VLLALCGGLLGAGCAPAGAAKNPTGAWPEGLESDFFAPVPESTSALSSLSGHAFARSRDARSLETSWSLAAAEWGDESGGFPTPEALTQSEMNKLGEGWTVARPFEFEVRGHAYVGGVAFQIIQAESEEVLSALLDVEQLPDALPLTHRARLISSSGSAESGGAEKVVEVIQGNSLMKARYSVRLTRVGEHAIRFSMDPGRHHDIRDARGYFTATRFSERHTLVTVAVGIDLGHGLARSMLKRPVQKAALSAPAHLRRYVEPRAAAANGSVVASR